MADKFLNGQGLSAVRTWVLGLLGNKQDTLVSGTNIKTINNTSLLGSGNIDVSGGGGSDVDVDVQHSGSKFIASVAKDSEGANQRTIIFDTLSAEANQVNLETWRGTIMANAVIPTVAYVDNGLSTKQNTLVSGANIKTVGGNSLLGNGDVAFPTVDQTYDDTSANAQSGVAVAEAISDIANPNEAVTFNASGQLDVGGRLGAFNGTTGVFHSKDREPRRVEDFSFLITDAKGMNLNAPRDLALATGVNLSLKGSHSAGSTTYQVSNTYANRIACYGLRNGGYLGQNEAWCKENLIVPVQSVTINGSSSWTPDSTADSSTNNIVITVGETANPTSAVSQLRVFGGITGGFCSEYVGQCVGGTLGASLAIGQRVYSSGNVNCIVSEDTWNSGNGNAIFGRLHISRKNRWFIAGSGHDTTSGRSEAGAVVGEYSDITSGTIFAVGNGTSQTARSNIFEVQSDSGATAMILKSPNGSKFKVTVDNSGNLTTTAVT